MVIVQSAAAFANASYSPLSPFLLTQYHLTNTALGAIPSIIFAAGALTSLTGGTFIDVWGYRKMLNLSSFIMAVSGFSGYYTHSFRSILVVFFSIGLSYGIVAPATNQAILTAYFPNHGPRIGLKQAGVSLGGLFATFALPMIAGSAGLRWSFLGIFFASILGLLANNLNLPRYRRRTIPPDVKKILHCLTDSSVLLLSLIIIVFFWLQQSLLTYYVLFMFRYFSFHLSELMLALLFLGSVSGRIVWGILNERIFHRNRLNGLATVGLFSGALLCLLSLGSYIWYIEAFLTFLLGMTSMGWNGLYLTTVSEIAPNGLIGSASGVSVAIGYLGVIVGLPLSGVLIDKTGSYVDLWLTISAVITVFSVALMVPMVQKLVRAHQI